MLYSVVFSLPLILVQFSIIFFSDFRLLFNELLFFYDFSITFAPFLLLHYYFFYFFSITSLLFILFLLYFFPLTFLFIFYCFSVPSTASLSYTVHIINRTNIEWLSLINCHTSFFPRLKSNWTKYYYIFWFIISQNSSADCIAKRAATPLGRIIMYLEILSLITQAVIKIAFEDQQPWIAARWQFRN